MIPNSKTVPYRPLFVRIQFFLIACVGFGRVLILDEVVVPDDVDE